MAFDRNNARWYNGLTGAPFVGAFGESGNVVTLPGSFSGLGGNVNSIVIAP